VNEACAIFFCQRNSNNGIQKLKSIAAPSRMPSKTDGIPTIWRDCRSGPARHIPDAIGFSYGGPMRWIEIPEGKRKSST
jgi:hypothetical protein